VKEAEVPWTDKFVCMAMLVPWSIRNRPGLWKDFYFSVAHALGSMKGPKDPTQDTRAA
jgi:hypothetical protein